MLNLGRHVVFLLSAAAGGTLAAADIETQHALDVTVPLRPKLELVLHSRVRTQPGGLGFYQVRTGPILSWSLRPRVTLIGGYYFARQEQQIDFDFIGGHRPFGGGEISIVDARRVSWDQRFLAERFLPDAVDDFSRYRFRTRFSAKGSVAPYGSYEVFLDAQGWRSTRYSVGLRWSALRNVKVDIGYFYEQRRPNVGPDRHMWLTSIQLTRSPRRADPDR